MKRLGIKLSTIYSENINRLQAESGKEIDLIETIEIYFKNNQSIQQTAKELFIHRHTLRYRLDQVEQRTGLNLKSTDDLLKRSEEHTSELQSRGHLVCRLLLEKKKKT